MIRVLVTNGSMNLPSELEHDLKLLNFEIQSSYPENKNYLYWDGHNLELHVSSGKNLKIDFSESTYLRKLKPSTDLLCRACGWHLGLRKLWDFTAGLGVDSYILSRAGFSVTAYERNPYLACLLRKAWRDGQKTLGSKMQLEFIYADGEKVIDSIDKDQVPEVVYYDPMYPPSKKTALPSKAMQILRELNGVHEESKILLEKTLALGVRRVVVKRPHRAPPIIEKPKSQIIGKLLRFDIYH